MSNNRQSSFIARRSFLMSSLAVALTVSMPLVFANQPTLPQSIDAKWLASLITGKEISNALAEKAIKAITVVNSNYIDELVELNQFITANGVQDIEILKNTTGFEGKHKKTAQQLLSALYLGYAGTPKSLTADDGVQFVTFVQAQTFQLTYDMTPIPSYSRWQSGYWKDLPLAAK